MDLFTYLMAKNGNNTSINEDLFSYLLGKAQGGGGQIKTASGITIYIPDAKKLVSFMMTKESTQATTQGTNLIGLDTQQYKVDLKAGDKITVFYDASASNQITLNLYTNYGDTIKNDYWTIYGGNQRTITVAYDSKAIDWYGNLVNIAWINKGETLLPYEEYTGGIPSPNPDYPQEVKTVKGYRNLFDKNNANILNAFVDNTSDTMVYSATAKSLYLKCKANTNYTITKISSARFRVASCDVVPQTNSEIQRLFVNNDTATKATVLTNNIAEYLIIYYYSSTSDTLTEQEILNSIMIVEGDQELPYVPYGNNYVNVAVSDGTNTNKYPIPLNNNELVGIGDYKDELLVDKSGHVFINKKFGKRTFNGTENWVTNESGHLEDVTRFYLYGITAKNTSRQLCSHFKYQNGLTLNSEHFYIYGYQIYMFITNSIATTLEQFKTWLLNQYNNGTPVDVYYEASTEELIDLQTTVDLSLFKGVNNVSNSEDGYMTIEYK